MNNYCYEGPFAKYIQEHIKLKKSIGYKYETEARHLLRFSVFTNEKYSNSKELTKNIVLDWCSKKKYETNANQCSRASIMRQLSIYINNIGCNAYIIPKGYFNTGKHYIPYIYTINELKNFFHETDNCYYIKECPDRHHVMPLIFRIIYYCGLRCSEARLLKVEDVDIQHGILNVNYSKNGKSRLVPMSEKITEHCYNFYSKVHIYSNKHNYFFPGINGNPITLSNIYKNFRRFLWRAGISHGGRGKGPRIHDFRHTFACNCLKKWVIEGKDLGSYLPILKTYLGHDTFEETAYYLRMTADVFPDISIKLESTYPDIIPDLEGDSYESN